MLCVEVQRRRMRSRCFSKEANRLPDGSEDGVVAEELPGVTREVGDAPASGLVPLGFADPAEHLLDVPGDGGQQARRFEFGEGVCLGIGEAAVGPLEDGPA